MLLDTHVLLWANSTPDRLGAEHLGRTAPQAATVERLPMLHRDPFDRLLAAQASTEALTLVTADDRLLAYPVTTVDART
ncbi:MAG: hypothetical protein JST73_02085 [Actinobacteria bacterium]|nr:hypothetical protein [Actinomycetota bacterium]